MTNKDIYQEVLEEMDISNRIENDKKNRLENLKKNIDNYPLHKAVMEWNFKEVKRMIEKEWYEVDEEGYEGETPLCVAIRNQSKNIIKYLVKKGANKNSVNIFWLPVLFCIDKIDLKFLKFLEKEGFDLNKRDAFDWSLLEQLLVYWKLSSKKEENWKYVIEKEDDIKKVIEVIEYLSKWNMSKKDCIKLLQEKYNERTFNRIVKWLNK